MIPPKQTESERQRAAGWSDNHKRGMTAAEVFQLNERGLALFPTTLEERHRKSEGMEAMPEFVC
jgi:hypothetical protein